MKKLEAIFKRIFCLPPLWTVFWAFLGYGFILIIAVFHIEIPFLQYASYLASAYALVITITSLPYIKTAVKSIKIYILKHPLMQKFRSTKIGEKYLTDIHFRTGVSLYQGFFINLLYIVMKLISGIYYRSTWFMALAVYYILLAAMRMMLIRRKGVPDKELELRRYRLCGFMLLFMNQALAGIVIFMVHQNKGFDYPGRLIYAMAVYSFYAIITATVSVFKIRSHNSPILSASKAINLVAAMVSILSLETAMLAQFGGDDTEFRATMTGATGGVVCTIVIGMAVYMIWKANRLLKRFKSNSFQT